MKKYEGDLLSQLWGIVKEAKNSPSEAITLAEYQETSFYKGYRRACDLIQAERGKLKHDPLKFSKAKILFLRGFQALFRFWEGTRWDFYGKTTFPRRGAVSCGNFIYNLMKDLGVQFPEKITSRAPIYCGKGPVSIWQALSAEQVSVYCHGQIKTYRSVRNNPEEKSAFVNGIAERTFPLFIAGEADHIVLMAPLMKSHDLESPFEMYAKLGVFEAQPGDQVKVEPVESNFSLARSNIMVLGTLERTIESWIRE